MAIVEKEKSDRQWIKTRTLKNITSLHAFSVEEQVEILIAQITFVCSVMAGVSYQMMNSTNILVQKRKAIASG